MILPGFEEVTEEDRPLTFEEKNMLERVTQIITDDEFKKRQKLDPDFMDELEKL